MIAFVLLLLILWVVTWAATRRPDDLRAVRERDAALEAMRRWQR